MTGRVFPLDGLKLLPPVVPSKIIGIALNYPDNPPPPDKAGPGPGYFAKLPSALIGEGGEIVPPADSTNLNYEGEMVVVIGKQARKVSPKEALYYVFVVTAGNDVTERGYWFMIKDKIDPCGFAYVSNQVGVIFNAEPIR